MKGRLVRAVVVLALSALGIGVLWGQIASGVDGEELVMALFASELLIIGSVLVLKAPDNRVSWLVFVIAAAGVVVGAVELGNPKVAELVSGIFLFALLLPGLAGFLPLWFPTGSPPGKRWRWVGWLYLPAVVLIVGGTGYAAMVEGLDTYDMDCVSAGSCAAIGGLALLLLMVAAAVASFVARWLTSVGVEKNQLKWLVPPFVFLGIGVLAEFGGFQDSLVASLFGGLGAVLIPIAIALAITRYRLYDIDRIVSRTVSYVLVVGLLAVVFATGVVWIPTALGLDDSPLLVAGSTLAVAALFNPLRRWVQSWVDRRFNRSRYEAERVIDQFAGSLRDRVDADGVVAGWVGVVSETMQPTVVSVWVRK